LPTSTSRKPTVRRREPLTEAEIQAYWRVLAGGPDFIGPVAPPMWLWARTIGRGRYWERPFWWLESVYPKQGDLR
jgi:hypothetical protein